MCSFKVEVNKLKIINPNIMLLMFKYRCDNIRDCANGEDETQCTFCNYDEFKCLSDQKCISDKWHCDGVEDCSDGSDESDCDIDEDGENIHDISHYDDDDDENPKFDYKDYSDDFSTADDHDDKIISTGDGIVPIFINPNSTSSTIDVANDDGDSSKKKKFMGLPLIQFKNLFPFPCS